MAEIEDTCKAIAALRFTGVRNHYSMYNLPVILNPPDLPAVIMSFDDTYNEFARPIGFTQSSVSVGLSFRMDYLRSFGEHVSTESDRMAKLPLIMDGVFGQLTGHWRLKDDDLLNNPLVFNSVRWGLIDWGGELYAGFQIRFSADVLVA